MPVTGGRAQGRGSLAGSGWAGVWRPCRLPKAPSHGRWPGSEQGLHLLSLVSPRSAREGPSK